LQYPLRWILGKWIGHSYARWVFWLFGFCFFLLLAICLVIYIYIYIYIYIVSDIFDIMLSLNYNFKIRNGQL
jgi:hypothetical protein